MQSHRLKPDEIDSPACRIFNKRPKQTTVRNKSRRCPSVQAWLKSIFLATARNPDVAGVHNENDFNMSTRVVARASLKPPRLRACPKICHLRIAPYFETDSVAKKEQNRRRNWTTPEERLRSGQSRPKAGCEHKGFI